MLDVINIILTEHNSKGPAGFHIDVRIQDPKIPNEYFSWATKKLPLNINDKIVAIETKKHPQKWAYYQSNSLKVTDRAKAKILKYKEGSHIVFVFMYGKYKNQKWILYKMPKRKKTWILFRGHDA